MTLVVVRRNASTDDGQPTFVEGRRAVALQPSFPRYRQPPARDGLDT